MDHYWNCEDFEGLKAVAVKYAQIDSYKHFSDYCKYREAGLRKEAMASVKRFVDLVLTWEFSKQKKIADELATLQYMNQGVSLLPHPLMQLLLNIFDKWSKESENTQIPYRWLGYLKHDMDYFTKALRIAPKDQISIIQMASFYIDGVDYDMHHLGESIFLGDESESEKDLEIAIDFINRIDSKEIQSFYLKSFEETKSMFLLWKRYKSLNIDEPFPEWNNKQGMNFQFPTTVYFEK